MIIVNYYVLDDDKNIHRLINTHVEASKIGRQIADQVLDAQKRREDLSTNSPDAAPDSSLHIEVNTLELKFLDYFYTG